MALTAATVRCHSISEIRPPDGRVIVVLLRDPSPTGVIVRLTHYKAIVQGGLGTRRTRP